MSDFQPLVPGPKPRRREADSGPTPFVVEANRLLAARIAAKTPAEKDDAEWALTYLFQMNRAGRLDEYMALRDEQQARVAARNEA